MFSENECLVIEDGRKLLQINLLEAGFGINYTGKNVARFGEEIEVEFLAARDF